MCSRWVNYQMYSNVIYVYTCQDFQTKSLLPRSITASHRTSWAALTISSKQLHHLSVAVMPPNVSEVPHPTTCHKDGGDTLPWNQQPPPENRPSQKEMSRKYHLPTIDIIEYQGPWELGRSCQIREIPDRRSPNISVTQYIPIHALLQILNPNSEMWGPAKHLGGHLPSSLLNNFIRNTTIKATTKQPKSPPNLSKLSDKWLNVIKCLNVYSKIKVLHIILPQTNPHPQRCLVLPERCNCITSKSPVLKESTSSFIKSNLFRFPCGSPQWPRFSPRLRRAPWPEGG